MTGPARSPKGAALTVLQTARTTAHWTGKAADGRFVGENRGAAQSRPQTWQTSSADLSSTPRFPKERNDR